MTLPTAAEILALTAPVDSRMGRPLLPIVVRIRDEVASNDTDIATLTSDLAALDVRVSALETDVSEIGWNILGPTSLSGLSSVTFTDIPSWAQEISLSFSDISSTTAAIPCVRLGDSGGLETTGYNAAAVQTPNGLANAGSGSTTLFPVVGSQDPLFVTSGHAHLFLHDPSTNTWTFTTVVGYHATVRSSNGGGTKALSGTLDRVQFLISNLVDTFDSGSVTLRYRR
jgi:hypothetical protein